MLIQYIYEYIPVEVDGWFDKTDGKWVTETYFMKRPFACVVCVAPDRIGASVCNPCDNFVKSRARQIAAARAQLYSKIKIPHITGEVISWFNGVNGRTFGFVSKQQLLSETIEYVRARSVRYFETSTLIEG